MTDDQAPKTAYELAMERLKKKDADEGVQRQPITDAQKAAIAEIRNFYESKLAEVELLHQGRMRASFDPAERDKLEQEYRVDRERLTNERESKIEKARKA
jgi:hypothetical protein